MGKIVATFGAPAGTMKGERHRRQYYILSLLDSLQAMLSLQQTTSAEQVRRPVSRVLSTPRRAMDGHSSGTPVTGRLARPTRAATRKHRCRLPGVPPLFGLAPGGVCRAACVAARAVGSYPTVSPLPAQQAGPAVCSLWHFPWGRPRRPLAGTVSPWSPDFPHPAVARRAQPSSRLTRGV